MAILLFRYAKSRVRQEISNPKCVRIFIFRNSGEEKLILLKYNQLIAPICDTKILFTH